MSYPKSATRPSNNYDLILIGSGIGALTIASLMAQMRGKRVLVLERHFTAGGFTHAFQRQKYHWDVGIHYVGDMAEDSPTRKLFDLITRNGVQWTKMPDRFEKFVYPGTSLDVPSNKKRYIAALVRKFPQEEKAIRQYFRDTAKATSAYMMQVMRRSGSLLLNLTGWLYGIFNPTRLNLTTQTYLDLHFQSPALKALLASQ